MLSTMRVATVQHGRKSTDGGLRFARQGGTTSAISIFVGRSSQSARSSATGVTRRNFGLGTQQVAQTRFFDVCGNAPALLRHGRPRVIRNPVGRSRLFCGETNDNKKPAKGFEKFYRESTGRDAKKPQGTKTTEAKETTADKKPTEKQAEGASNGKQAKTKTEKGGKKGEKGKSPNDAPQSQQMTMLGMSVGAFLVLMATQGSFSESADREVTIQELLRDYVLKGHVEMIQIVNKTFCRVQLRPDAPVASGGDRTLIIQLGTPDAFEMKLEQLQTELGLSTVDHVPIQYVNETDIMSTLLPLLPSLLLIIPLIFAARAMSGGMGGMGGSQGGNSGGRNIFSIGKAFPQGQKDLKSKVKFNDVAGLEQAKQEVVEFVDFLKNPSKYEHLGARVPKGGLLVGPPGTGKTLLAKAVAGEADCPFFSMSGSDFIEMFVGVGPSRVRDLFQQARAAAPSIVFIDEIDAVGRKRGGGGFSGGGNDERENTLNQLLVEMDGFSSGTGVVVLAGTNRADILDPALKRPGRFDRQIAIDKPDLNERQSIFMVHLKPITLSAALDSENVAKRMAALTPGFAGSDIANICNEAAIFAARRDSMAVEMEDFERATERILGGLPKTNNLMSAVQKRTVALHESGHAVAGWFLENADPLLKVSIVPRSSGALGFAQYLPEEMSLYSKESILDKIAVSLGGRAAEDLFVGGISTGASDDLDKVTKMAYAMVAVYGMNPELGLLSYSQNNATQQFYKPYSEETGRLIDREARNIVETQYERVKALLLEKKDLLIGMADALAEKETLVYNELRALLGERPFAIQGQYSQFATASGARSVETTDGATEEGTDAKVESASAKTVPEANVKTDVSEPKEVDASLPKV
eukprot:TRINITY_DN2411_c0_g2_i1.p1 TRINITY_DN2411_c0_g2~~TRINITY_DN2411_c0_g2_i1.p1  ORF type:complete len:896 (-),score=169.82 TRINITY_DN2411_c0_g2_i1:158-2758(-)